MYYFTGDLHIDHPWIAAHRGFTHTVSHDKAIVDGWNSVVRPSDVVVVLGDVFWTTWGVERYMKLWSKGLNGTKILVKGNHDRWVRKARVPFKRIWNKTFKQKGGHKQHIVACHFPFRSWNRKQYGAIHIHGHCHGSILPERSTLDVGVDVAKLMLGEYRPFSFNEVLYLTGENNNVIN